MGCGRICSPTSIILFTPSPPLSVIDINLPKILNIHVGLVRHHYHILSPRRPNHDLPIPSSGDICLVVSDLPHPSPRPLRRRRHPSSTPTYPKAPGTHAGLGPRHYHTPPPRRPRHDLPTPSSGEAGTSSRSRGSASAKLIRWGFWSCVCVRAMINYHRH